MIRGFEPRLYQQIILDTAVKKNTLVVLPTGLGKTNIAVLLAANRLTNYPNSKILILAPTRPLCDQHVDSLRKYLDVDEDDVQLFTGMISPAKRAELWKKSKIIVSTPQGLENDVISNKISLKDVSLLVVDEAHRAVGDYAYVFIVKQYNKKAEHPRILGLTASPGSDQEKIKEVCKNIFVEEIEFRYYDDPDVKQYVQQIDVERVYVDLPEDFEQIRNFLRNAFDSKLATIKNLGFMYGNTSSYSKTSLLELQRGMFAKLNSGEKDFSLMRSVSLLAEALKLQHALELVETQGLKPLFEYLSKLEDEAQKTKVKAVQNLVRDLNFRSAMVKTKNMIAAAREHPKIIKLREIISEELKNKKDVKIIIFNQYRDSTNKIKEVLDSLKVESRIFVGQAKKKDTGMSQKEQKKIIEQFREGVFNCLIATSVAEEGLDIPSVDLVIFYEPVPSAIRTVQRRGRTGRQEKGRVIVLITKKTRDEGNLWASFHKEKRMYRVMHALKKGFSPAFERTSESRAVLNESESEKQTRLVGKDAEKFNVDLSIFADYREKGSGIIKNLADKGVKIDLIKMDVGDYLLSERVVVEHKTIRDFVDSIIDGRLLSQLSNLKKYEKPFIIIEGEDDIYSQRKIHPNAIRGVLATIIISYGIPVLQTKNFRETAELFLLIAKREAYPSKKEFTLHTAKPLADKDIQEYIIGAFPGVGATIAKPLLRKFKSIKKIVNAKEEDLKKVELIGDKKAKRIKEIVDKKYEE
ncbi:MAG: DEAD/DEAH box helicase [Nanoarchaeota archaeon]|nr:DEAD/DEAH box helicase [Nanoarchaeota archaeon]MBU1321131.1 DEAD/DEAH box helicase [Nanoarchaeota archaeon]MBU1597962.1 DEAD/DEAH box helicase [Nanoarchaeota archaeon]MBU2441807.1 DEAD/DEAH box helicase [Nanoarchaeota archaeon]